MSVPFRSDALHPAAVDRDALATDVGCGRRCEERDELRGLRRVGEAALRDGSRTAFPNGTDLPERKDELLFSALAGLEYTFLSELTLVAEYFYNGEGFNEEERAAYLTALGPPDSATVFGSLAAEYRPGYLSRHYALVNLLYPLYDTVFKTGSGETITFEKRRGLVTGMSIAGSGGTVLAPRVELYTEETVSY